jgi:hypothetical protein
MEQSPLSAKALLQYIDQQIESGNYSDSVHKIKLMTAREVIAKILRSEF